VSQPEQSPPRKPQNIHDSDYHALIVRLKACLSSSKDMNVRFSGWSVVDVDSVLRLLHCMSVGDVDITDVHSASICRVEVYRLVSCADSDFHAAQPLAKKSSNIMPDGHLDG
jgi:hypothetical protein